MQEVGGSNGTFSDDYTTLTVWPKSSGRDDFEQRLGQDALKTLWYSRIRDRIWSWAYREWTGRSEHPGWAMSIVFDWIADQADVLGDLPAAAINRELHPARPPPRETGGGGDDWVN